MARAACSASCASSRAATSPQRAPVGSARTTPCQANRRTGGRASSGSVCATCSCPCWRACENWN
eukprot:4778712-Lingulodinium_polyedra.AAC.1